MNSPAEPAIVPSTAVIVSASVVGGSTLATGFEVARIATPAELEGALAGQACVAITGLPVAEYAAVVQQILSLAAQDVLVVVDAEDATWPQLVINPVPLSGLTALGARRIGGRGAALLVRSAVPAAPDLGLTREQLAALPPLDVAAADEPDRAVPAVKPEDAPALVAALQNQVDELSIGLSAAHAALATEQAKSVPHTGRMARFARRFLLAVKARGLLALLTSRTVRRMLIPLAAAFIGLLAIIGISIGIPFIDSARFKEGLLAAVVLIGLAVSLYVARAVRRIGRNSANTARQVQRMLDSQQVQQKETRRQQEAFTRKTTVSAAATQDLIRQVDALRKENARLIVRSGQQRQSTENLFAMTEVAAAIPMMGGWAASADVVLALVDELIARRPSLIVECGAGVSTVWLALTARHHGIETKIVGLEHDAHFAELTRTTLERHGLSDIAEVRLAPLVPIELAGHDTPWYDPSVLGDLQGIGMLFIDGPPESTGPRVRYPAIPMLRDRFADRVTIVLDDLIRASEQEILAAWQDELPDFAVAKLDLEKGAGVLRRG